VIFRYKARDSAGALQEGRLDVPTRADALARLQGMGLVVVDLKEGAGFSLNQEVSLGGARRVSSRDLATFCAQLASLLGAGVPIVPSLQVMARQFSKGPLGSLLPEVVRSIEAGNSFSQALRENERALPPSLIYITAVAEVTGNLDTSYSLLANHFEHDDNFTRKVRSAFTYPAVVLSVALGVIVFMVTVVLPTYGQLFGQMGAELPASTRVLMALGQGIKRYWYLIPVVLLLGSWGVWRVYRRPRVRAAWERFWLRVPAIGPLLYKRNLAQLTRTLGMMLRSGVPLISALETVEESLDNQPFRDAVRGVQEEVRQGETFGRALSRQPLFDRTTVEIVALGESAGTVDTMLFRVADQTEKDVNTLLDRLTQLLEPALTVVLGVIVVSIIVPMILPMFDILGKVR